MNSPSAVCLVVAGLFALGDWYARLRHRRALELVCKPATLVALVVAAIVLDPASGAHSRRVWFVFALLASLKGDVFLMLGDGDTDGPNYFILGLLAFLVAHVLYIGGFWAQGVGGASFALALAVVIVMVAPIAIRVLGALRSEPMLRPPVAVYMAVISVMFASALAAANPWAAVGAGLFVASDSMIAWDRFVRPFSAAGVLIMVTYHLGQAGLVVSLLH
ncbi:MAG TPA: lysoplasmalogenase [Acidimicrobiia bacterium]|nr:lysoplasmalogenase [Acidimicrobiia bacterium]